MADTRVPEQIEALLSLGLAPPGRLANPPTGSSKAIDWLEASATAAPEFGNDTLEDDRLRMIFACRHPALSADARIAFTLRERTLALTTQLSRRNVASSSAARWSLGRSR